MRPRVTSVASRPRSLRRLATGRLTSGATSSPQSEPALPHQVVACALDRPSYAVSQITDQGYLRVHRIGRGSRHPLWDQQFEAQQVRVLTAAGPVAGVVARSNGHFAQQHRLETAVVSADDLWLDVGAESRAEVEQLGIALLDPVSRHLPPWPMAGGVAGPDAGRRTGCAAVATLPRPRVAATLQGRTTFVLSAQEATGWVGLSSLIARAERVDRVTILAPGEDARAESDRAAGTLSNFGGVLLASGVKTVRWLAPMVQQAGSHMEVVRNPGSRMAARPQRQRPPAWRSPPATRGPRLRLARHYAPTSPTPRCGKRPRCSRTSLSGPPCPATSGPCAGRCWNRCRPGRATARSSTTSATSRWRPGPRDRPPCSWPTWTKSDT